MPSVKKNFRKWNASYDWASQGEEWSEAWGGSGAQWATMVLPRIKRFLPAGTILEIGPGRGRWTHYLGDHCSRLIGVDISPECIAACRTRFASRPHLSFHVNDGYTLDAVGDSSVDFAFSFDSLVHAEMDVIASYLRELARTLKPEGVAFIHHSNVRACINGPIDALRMKLRPPHWRSSSVSAALFANACTENGFRCIDQELVQWCGHALHTDCFSMCVRAAPLPRRA